MNRSLITLLSVFAVVAAVFGSYTAGVVFARHYVHLGMNPIFQKTPAQTGGNTLPENYVNVKWALHSGTEAEVTWHSEPEVRDLFVAALTNWTNTIPELRWREVSSSADADVNVFTGSCGVGALGYFEVRDFVPTNPSEPSGWHTDDERSANYWKSADICSRPSSDLPQNRTDDYALSIVAHEIGHAYGLHEAYIDNPPPRDGSPCNNSVISVMDGVHTKLFTSADGGPAVRKWTHCDGLTGPSQWDVARIRDFFASGGPVDFTSELSGNQGTFRWRDDAWGEARHEMRYLYRLDSENENQAWVKYETSSVVNNTGRHKQIAGVPIRFRQDIGLKEHTKGRATQTLPVRTAYQVCGRGVFTQYNPPALLTCSLVVKVSNAEHNAIAPIARRYDANNNGMIERSELDAAINDYLFPDEADLPITRAQVIALINIYLFG